MAWDVSSSYLVGEVALLEVTDIGQVWVVEVEERKIVAFGVVV